MRNKQLTKCGLSVPNALLSCIRLVANMVTGGHDSVVNVNATWTKRRLAHATALRY